MGERAIHSLTPRLTGMTYQRSPCPSRSRDMALSRDLHVEYSAVSNTTATIKETTSSQQIVYVYCSPKVVDAIAAIWKVILLAYCVGTPIFISLLYRENEFNLERLSQLNKSFEIRKLNVRRNTTKLKPLLKPMMASIRVKRAIESRNSRTNTNSQLGSNFDAESNRIKHETKNNLRKTTKKSKPSKALGLDHQTFDEYCPALRRKRREATNNDGLPMDELDVVLMRLRSALQLYDQKVKNTERTYGWMKSLSWEDLIPSADPKDVKKETCDCPVKNTAYIRWGGNSCPKDNRTTSLYTGYMSGNGGTNFLCLPTVPHYDRFLHDDNIEQKLSQIDGVRYGENEPLFEQTIADKAVPCSLCHVNQMASTIMLPALSECPRGWTVLYAGHIVAMEGRKRSKFVCLQNNSDAEKVRGSRRILTGSIQPIHAKCGSILKCDSYRTEVELSCVVCGR